MPEKRPKRPRDPAQLAKLMIDIASGEVEDGRPPPSTAAEHGREGGLKRARNLSPERRAEVAKKAARVRWGKDRVARAKKEHA
jgi:hypothetical protein